MKIVTEINQALTTDLSKTTGKKILIADDSQAIRILLKEILATDTAATYEYLESGDGLDTIKKFRDHKPDITILDVNMPVANGIQVLKGIMKLDKEAKVIMTTAAGNASVALQAIRLGARDYLLKPFDRTLVTNMVNTVSNQRR